MDPKEATSVRELYEKHRDWGKETLNGESVYCWAVRMCKYEKIGIIVNKGGEEIGRYASHNNLNGSIDKIVDDFNIRDVDVAVKVEESALLDILENMDYVTAHPIQSFLHYSKAFEFVKGSFVGVAAAVLSGGWLKSGKNKPVESQQYEL